jgi:hypothetical protein
MPPQGIKKPTLPLHLLKELGASGEVVLGRPALGLLLTDSQIRIRGKGAVAE